MKEKLVIFDLDGVLVNACEWHRVALNDALRGACAQEISKEEHIDMFNGLPTRVKLKMLVELGRIPETSCDLVYDTKQAKTVEVIEKYATIRKEKQIMISRLKEAGVKVACYTNSIRETAELMLEKTGILELFDYVLTNQDVKMPKPDPEGYLFLMEHFGISKENTLIIEDSPKGVQAATSSGARTIKVNGPDIVDLNLFKGYFE